MPPKGISTRCSNATTFRLAGPPTGDHPIELQLGDTYQETQAKPNQVD